MPIFAVSSNTVQLLPSQTLGLLDQMSPKLYTMEINSSYLIFWNQKCDITIYFGMAVPQGRLAYETTEGKIHSPSGKFAERAKQ